MDNWLIISVFFRYVSIMKTMLFGNQNILYAGFKSSLYPKYFKPYLSLNFRHSQSSPGGGWDFSEPLDSNIVLSGLILLTYLLKNMSSPKYQVIFLIIQIWLWQKRKGGQSLALWLYYVLSGPDSMCRFIKLKCSRNPITGMSWNFLISWNLLLLLAFSTR